MSRDFSQIKGQDILLLLKLLKDGRDRRMVDLALELGVSQTEISFGMERLKNAKLLRNDKRAPYRENALEFIVHGLKYTFPASPGKVVRGIPTAHSAPPLAKDIVPSGDVFVWANDKGDVRGQEISPIYKSAPEAALKDKELYEMLALIDALRVGRTREQKMAIKEIKGRIGGEVSDVS